MNDNHIKRLESGKAVHSIFSQFDESSSESKNCSAPPPTPWPLPPIHPTTTLPPVTVSTETEFTEAASTETEFTEAASTEAASTEAASTVHPKDYENDVEHVDYHAGQSSEDDIQEVSEVELEEEFNPYQLFVSAREDPFINLMTYYHVSLFLVFSFYICVF